METNSHEANAKRVHTRVRMNTWRQMVAMTTITTRLAATTGATFSQQLTAPIECEAKAISMTILTPTAQPMWI